MTIRAPAGLSPAFGSDGQAYLIKAVAQGCTVFRLTGEPLDKPGQIRLSEGYFLASRLASLIA